MSVDRIIELIGLLIAGGFLQWALTWWRNRKTDARKELAAADTAQATAANAQAEYYRNHIDWLEKRLADRDAKVDATYRELRQEQNEKLEVIFKLHEVELLYKDAEYNRCNMSDGECTRRTPPRKPKEITEHE